MTNEQLTQEVISLAEKQAKSEAEHQRFVDIIKELQEDVKTTKNLAEDVHIMAINMQNMQKAQEEINKKVDALTSKEFTEYKENKKLVKNNIISAVVGAICTIGLGAIGWVILEFIKRGGN